MNKGNVRHTVTIDDKTYQLLRRRGNFGETYSEVISRSWRKAQVMIIADFISRQCKEQNHTQCIGRWTGVAIEVVCNCKCDHKKPK